MTTINLLAGTMAITTGDSMTKINTNFTNLNSDKIETSYLDTDTTLAANSDSKIATQKAVKAYVDSGGNQNASETARGIVEEATDAEVTAGTATGATGAKLFVTPAKLKTAVSSFAGDGSDGVLNTSSGVVNIDCDNKSVVIKQYSSVNVVTNNVTFSNVPATGCIFVLKCMGNAVISATIDLKGKGGAGGTAGSGGYGTSGSGGNGNNGATYWLPEGFGVGATGMGSSDVDGTGATGGVIIQQVYPKIEYLVTGKELKLKCGAGGGGGAGGRVDYNPNGTADAGGTGGNGGGCLYMEVGGSLDFTGTIDVRGNVGGAAPNVAPATGSAQTGGGGGGGAGGLAVVVAKTIISSAGTINTAGGAGGAGGNATYTTGTAGNGYSGGGGAGGASYYSAGANGGNGGGSVGSNATSFEAGGGGGGGNRRTSAGTANGGAGGAAGATAGGIVIVKNALY